VFFKIEFFKTKLNKMKVFLPKNYLESPDFQEKISQNNKFSLSSNIENDENMICLIYSPPNEIYELKLKIKDEIKKLNQYKLFESFLRERYSKEDLFKCFEVFKIGAILDDQNQNNSINNNDQLNKRIFKKFEELYINNKILSKSKKDEIQCEFNIYIANLIQNLIKNCEILFKNANFFLKSEDDLLFNEFQPNVKNLYDLISKMKSMNRSDKNKISLRKIENQFLRKLIDTKLFTISTLIQRKSENLLINRLTNHKDDLSTKEVLFEHISLRAKECEYKIGKKSNSLNSLDETKEKYNITKEEALNRNNESKEEELKKYIEKIKSIEKEIKFRRESLNKFKKI